MSSLNIETSAVTSVLPMIILLIILFLMFFTYIVYHILSQVLSHSTYLASSDTYESEGFWFGDDYVSQAGDMTTSAPAPTTAVDTTSSQLIAYTGEPQTVTNYLQTQVAAEIVELTNLKQDRFDEHYSTPMYMGQFGFNTTHGVNDVFALLDSKSIYPNNNFKRMFIDKRFASYDIRFTINITGNPMATGLVVFAIIPDYPNLPTNAASQDPARIILPYTKLLTRCLALDHLLIDVSVDGVYTIDMPYLYYRDYINCFDTPGFSYASLIGCVMSPLLPAVGAPTTVNFEIYATMINLDFCETAPYYSQGLFSSDTTNITYKLDNIRDSTLPLNVSGDALSATATIPFGFDNPSDNRNPPSMYQRFYQKITSVANVLDVFRASAQPEKVEVFDKPRMDSLRITQDEMSFDYFNERWAPEGYYKTNLQDGVAGGTPFAITNTTATNNVLFWTYLCPMARQFGGAVPTDSYSSDFRHAIVSNSLYWRGSLKYRICIAGNAFKRGKILVAIHYCPQNTAFLFSGPITAGELDPRSLPHVIVDLSSDDKYVDIEVPYKATTPILRNVGFNVDIGDITPVIDFGMGQLIVALVSPLQVSNGTASTVNLTLLSSWGKDMQFFVRPGVSRSGPVTQALLRPNQMVSTKEHTLSSLAVLTSFKQLLLEPVHYGTYEILGNTNLVDAPPTVAVPIHPQYLAASPIWSAMMAMYCGAKGSFRIIARVTDSAEGPVKLTVWPYLRFPATGAVNNAVLNDTGRADIPAVSNYFPGTTLSRPRTNYPTQYISSGVASVATHSYTHTIASDVQPEVVLEFPEPSPLYRTQPTSIIPKTYDYVGSPVYRPDTDRNVPWLVMSMVNPYFAPPAEGVRNVAATVSLYFLAGDDFRYFWFNGGPTTYGANSVYNPNTPTTIFPSPYNNP